MPRDERLPRRYEPGTSDVFCLLKQSLADSDLSQPALLVWPGDECEKAKAFLRDGASHCGQQTDLEPERAQELLELADALETLPQYSRAVAYMRSLAGKIPRTRRDAWPLDFLAAGGQAPRHDMPAQLPDRPARPDPYRMHVRFHRP